MLLVGCGATGAVAGIFKAPITGVLFTLEVLMLDLTMASIVPLIVTAITATVITFFISGTESQFAFDTTVSIIPKNIPYYVLEGIVCGFVSLYFVRGSNKLETFFRNINRRWKKLVVGGSMLSLLIFFIPPLYGEGYDTISSLINGDSQSITDSSVFYEFRENFWMLCLFCLLIVFFKIFATAATNGSGGTGGIFAPSLFMGCVSGFITASIINHLHITNLPTKNFALAGMAGVMAGVMHAPLTSTFLIAEITGGYGLFISIMTVAVTAYITIRTFEPHSLYAMRLAQKGELYTHHIDKNVQMMLNIDDLIDKEDNVLKGILTINDIRNVMFQPEYYKTLKVEQLMTGASALIYVENTSKKNEVEAEIAAKHAEMEKRGHTISANQKEEEMERIKEFCGDSVDEIMKKFAYTKAWNLAVVKKKSKIYVGFLSRAKVFNAYRDLLQKMSEE